MDAKPRLVRIYVAVDGKAPFQEWIDRLRDPRARARIDARIARLRAGNFGDSRAVGEGVLELRVHFGPGYRVYCAEDGDVIVVLLCGGDKSTQAADIARAKQYWEEYTS